MTDNNQAVAVYEVPRAEIMLGNAQSVANLCKDIVQRTTVKIGRSKHIRCEGWMAIAAAHGCIPSSGEVVKVDNGYVAKGYIRRISDGVKISEAEGFVGMDEPEWARKPEYACRAMAQTRAIGRACKASFAHVAIMIDEELSTTPAEEMPVDGFEPVSKPVSRPTTERPAAAASRPAPAAAQGDALQLAGYIKRVDSKPTKNANVTRFGVLIVPNADGTGDGTWLNTIEKTLGEAAIQNTGAYAVVTFTESKYGKDIRKIDLQQPPASAGLQMSAHEQAIVDAAGDDIKF